MCVCMYVCCVTMINLCDLERNSQASFFYFSVKKNQGPNKDGIQGVAPIGGFDNHDIASHVSGLGLCT